MAAMASFRKLQPEEFYLAHFERGERPDGRSGLTALRPVSVSVGSISTADGSAIVKQGETVVVCGIKLELAVPSPEKPDEGWVVPNLDLPPLCHPLFKPGPPPEAAQTASMFLAEVIRSSGLINPKRLCIEKGRLAWVVYIDLVCLNFGGNVLDVAAKAMVAALRNATVPQVTLPQRVGRGAATDDDDGGCGGGAEEVEEEAKVDVDLNTRSPLEVSTSPPFCCTVAVFNNRLLVDPTEEEEQLSKATVTVVIQFHQDKRDQPEICHLQKPGGTAVSEDTLGKCCKLAKEQAKKIRDHLDAALSTSIRAAK